MQLKVVGLTGNVLFTGLGALQITRIVCIDSQNTRFYRSCSRYIIIYSNLS
jgi:hypothetical protein